MPPVVWDWVPVPAGWQPGAEGAELTTVLDAGPTATSAGFNPNPNPHP